MRRPGVAPPDISDTSQIPSRLFNVFGVLRMNSRHSISLLAVLASVAAVGCGGSDETTSLTNAQFITQAEHICREAGEEQFAALGKALDGNGESASRKELESATRTVVLPRARQMVAELSHLQVPEKQSRDFASLVQQFEKGLERAEGAPRTFLSGGAFSTADKQAEELGLRGCNL